MGFLKFAMVIAVVVALFAFVSLPGYPETVNNRTGKEIQGVFMNFMKYVVSGICWRLLNIVKLWRIKCLVILALSMA